LHFSFITIYSGFAIFQILKCVFLILKSFSFLPYSWSYTVPFSFSTFLIVSCHIPGKTSFVPLFPRFFSFHEIFQVL
jgi:hypothetical protein